MSAPSTTSEATTPGVGLYFIDILACLVFCLSLALVGARFSRETSVAVALPQLEAAGDLPGELSAPVVAMRTEADGTHFYWEQEAVSREELRQRLQREAPEALVLRMEASEFTGLVADARAAGVADIMIAYDKRASDPGVSNSSGAAAQGGRKGAGARP